MGLLTSIGKMRLGLQGKTPARWPGDLPSSKLHNTSSVNNRPPLGKGQKPSLLDLDAGTPEQYINNLPK